MSTVGHFVTMLGVFFFYATLFESTIEKKITVITYNLLPRVYNEFSFIELKQIHRIVESAKTFNITNKKIRKHITSAYVVNA